MKTGIGLARERPVERNASWQHTSQVSSVYEAWDAVGSRRWHVELQQVGMRLGADKNLEPRDVNANPKRRTLWNRVCQAYDVLQGRAYTRPLRSFILSQAEEPLAPSLSQAEELSIPSPEPWLVSPRECPLPIASDFESLAATIGRVDFAGNTYFISLGTRDLGAFQDWSEVVAIITPIFRDSKPIADVSRDIGQSGFAIFRMRDTDVHNHPQNAQTSLATSVSLHLCVLAEGMLPE